METRHFDVFVTLVDEGSFRRAAQKLFMSQPALSQQINRLEKEVGTKLIDRSARPINPTAVGKRLYVLGKRVLEQVHEIESLFSNVQTGNWGKITLGMAPSLRYGRIPSIIKDYTDVNSNVEVELIFKATNELSEMLELGQVSIALMLTQPMLQGSQSRQLLVDPYVIALTSDHYLAQQDEVAFQQLRSERLITIPRTNAPENHDALVNACLTAGFSPKGPVAGGSYLEHVALTSAGMGLSFIPQSLASLKMPNIVYRDLVNPKVDAEVSICWFDDRLDSANRTFIDHCLDAFGASDQN